MKTIIAVDAGGTWIKAARFDASLTVQQEVKIPSGARQSRDAYFDSIAEAVRQLGGADPSTPVGLSLPGTFNKAGDTIRYTGNVAGLTPRDPPITVKEALARRLGTAKLIGENDASCAALAEWQHGRAQADPATSLLQLTWGTGIGTGFISAGASQYGFEGGHMPIAYGASPDTLHERCNCGSSLDLEALVAVPQLIKKAKRLLNEQAHDTTLTPAHFADERETSQALLTHAENNDALAQAVIDEALTWLARGLLAMSMLVYPDLVAIGGGMMSRDWLIDKLRAAIEREATTGHLQDALPPAHVGRTTLQNGAGVIGAAMLARQKFSV